ncbi:hypothetical protein B4100_2034 [Heyndrickxia coagulans]|nr:hypothetical protein B4100_2034 [Heyndrickxia coagulans]
MYLSWRLESTVFARTAGDLVHMQSFASHFVFLTALLKNRHFARDSVFSF